jgi:hypothetical protein
MRIVAQHNASLGLVGMAACRRQRLADFFVRGLSKKGWAAYNRLAAR